MTMGIFDKKDTPATAGAPTDEQNLNAKKQKYASAFEAANRAGVRLQNAQFANGKLQISGEAPSEDAKNKVWDAVKAMNGGLNPQDANVDIRVVPGQGGPAGGSQAPAGTYTVKSGDTLSKISKQFYGDGNAYMKIFNANKDKLKDPDKIQPGQQLTIPPKS
jgi:nucleoid-associated protein YgaU